MLDLKTLPQCGVCLTRVRTPGSCRYCREDYAKKKDFEEKIEVLRAIASASYRYTSPWSMVFKENRDKCDICHTIPKGAGADGNYLIYKVGETVCKNCNLKK